MEEPVMTRPPYRHWLVAAVVWLGLVAVAWFILPPRPRAVWADVPPVAWARVALPGTPHTVLVPPAVGVSPTAPNAIVLWDSAAGRAHELFSDEDDLPAYGFSPDGTWLLLDVDNRLQLCRVATAAVVADLGLTDRPPDDWRRRYAFAPDGATLAYSDWVGDRSVVRLFELNALRPAGTVAGAEAPLAFSPDGHAFAYRAGGECVVADWPGNAVRGRVADDGASRYELSPAGDRLFRVHVDGDERRVGCWDVAAGRCLWEVKTTNETALPGDRHWLFEQRCCDDLQAAEMTVTDTETGEVRGRFQLAGGECVVNVPQSSSPAGPLVAVVSESPDDHVGRWLQTWLPQLGVRENPGRVRLVDVTTGKTECDIPGAMGEATFTPDGRGVLVRSGTTLTLWDVPPRVPWTWLAAVAAVLAVVVAIVTRRRIVRASGAA
jgi:hypothetical protein